MNLRKKVLASLVKGDTRKSLVLVKTFGSWEKFLETVNKRQETVRALRNWQEHINAESGEQIPIFVENNVDLEHPPTNFVYIRVRRTFTTFFLQQYWSYLEWLYFWGIEWLFSGIIWKVFLCHPNKEKRICTQ